MVTPLEVALARVPVGSRVLVAGMPDEQEALPRYLRDRDCEVTALALTDEEAHAWGALVPTVRPGEPVAPDLALVRGACTEAPAPAALLAALPRVATVLVEDNPAHVSRWGVPGGSARRRGTDADALRLVVSGGGFEVAEQLVCESLPRFLPQTRAWQRTLEDVPGAAVLGWVLWLTPSERPQPADVRSASANDLARDDRLMLTSYRRALAAARARLDERDVAHVQDLHSLQDRMAAQLRVEHAVYRRALLLRRVVGRATRGLRGQAP